jgi:hypothetical protein
MQSQNWYITQIITIVKSATYIKYLKTGIWELFNLTILPMITFGGFQLSKLLKNEFNFRQNLICVFTFSLYFHCMYLVHNKCDSKKGKLKLSCLFLSTTMDTFL